MRLDQLVWSIDAPDPHGPHVRRPTVALSPVCRASVAGLALFAAVARVAESAFGVGRAAATQVLAAHPLNEWGYTGQTSAIRVAMSVAIRRSRSRVVVM